MESVIDVGRKLTMLIHCSKCGTTLCEDCYVPVDYGDAICFDCLINLPTCSSCGERIEDSLRCFQCDTPLCEDCVAFSHTGEILCPDCDVYCVKISETSALTAEAGVEEVQAPLEKIEIIFPTPFVVEVGDSESGKHEISDIEKVKDQLIVNIKRLDTGKGASFEKLHQQAGVKSEKLFEEALIDLLKQGIVYEPSPARYKILK